FTHPKWIDELISRSRPALLDVHFEDGPPVKSATKALRKTLADTYRLGTLSLPPVRVKPNRMNAIRSILSQPAPHLEKFVARAHEKDHEPIISEKLFSSCAPRLTTLELQGCKLSLEPPLFAALTTLKLRHEYLPVHNMHSKYILATSYYGITAHLPHLRHFEVDDAFDNYEALLPRLVYPKEAHQNFTLSCVHYDRKEKSVKRKLPNLQEVGRLIGERILPGWCMRIREELGTTHLAIWGRAGLVSNTPSEPPNLEINLSRPFDPPGLPYNYHSVNLSGLYAIWRVLPLAHLESLHVTSVIDRAMWLKFGRKKLLKNIRLTVEPNQYHVEDEFLKALQSGIPDKDIASKRPVPVHPKQGRLPLASLRNLILDGWSSRSLGHKLTTTSFLHLCLREHRKRGVALRQLRLLNVCKGWDNDYDKVIDKLSAVVCRSC
ncbi:hypothetical protein DXG01_004802, partial [Tephrocybe rancida]